MKRKKKNEKMINIDEKLSKNLKMKEMIKNFIRKEK